MEVRDEGVSEEDEESSEAVGPMPFPSFLAALFDDINVKILQVTTGQFLSVKDIADSCKIPVRACYRRVTALQKEGLLCPMPDEPQSRGRPSNRYISNIRDVYVSLVGGDYHVRLVWPTDKVELTLLP